MNRKEATVGMGVLEGVKATQPTQPIIKMDGGTNAETRLTTM